MSASSSSSSIEEEESISFAETAPEEISNPYEMKFDDSITHTDAQADAELEHREQQDAVDEYESDYEFDGSDEDPTGSAASGEGEQVDSPQQLDSVLREMLLAQADSASPRKTGGASAAAAPAAEALLAPLVSAPIEFANQLGILDPAAPNEERDAAAALSRSESSPLLARLLQRVQRHQRGMEAEREGGSSVDNPHVSTKPAAATPSATPSALHAATLAAPLPAPSLRALVAHLRSGAASAASRAHWALQPEMLPVPAPPRPRQGRVEALQREWDERAALHPQAQFQPGKENTASHSRNVGPRPDFPPAAQTSPAGAGAGSGKPLQLVTAQVRIEAALERMRTHRFPSRYHLPAGPASSSGCDFGAVEMEMDDRSGTPLLALHDPARRGCAHARVPAHGDGDAADEGFGRHRCNNGAGVHRAVWLDGVLNRLYEARTNPRTLEEEGVATLQRDENYLRSNHFRTQLDVFRAAHGARRFG